MAVATASNPNLIITWGGDAIYTHSMTQKDSFTHSILTTITRYILNVFYATSMSVEIAIIYLLRVTKQLIDAQYKV